MLAALGSHTDCVHILLEKGASPDATDKKGRTALHRAVSNCAIPSPAFAFLMLELFSSLHKCMFLQLCFFFASLCLALPGCHGQ